jgi:hypothetical protein
MEGHAARRLEASILSMLRSGSAVVAPFEGIQQFDGYTECWKLGTHPANSLGDLFRTAQVDAVSGT